MHDCFCVCLHACSAPNLQSKGEKRPAKPTIYSVTRKSHHFKSIVRRIRCPTQPSRARLQAGAASNRLHCLGVYDTVRGRRAHNSKQGNPARPECRRGRRRTDLARHDGVTGARAHKEGISGGQLQALCRHACPHLCHDHGQAHLPAPLPLLRALCQLVGLSIEGTCLRRKL